MRKDAVNEVRAGKVEPVRGNGLALVLKKRRAAVTKDVLKISDAGAHGVSLSRIRGVVQGLRTV